MNNKYTVKVGHPLLRPGLTIETEASERYLVPVTRTLMDKVREINQGSPPVPEFNMSDIRQGELEAILHDVYPVLREIVHQAYHVAEGSEQRMDVGDIVVDTKDHQALERALDATGHGDVHDYLHELDPLMGVDDQEGEVT